MNARRVNAAADVICRAMKTKQTAAGIAAALDAAGLLQSPEAAAEVEQMQTRVAELTALLKRAQDEARSAHGAEAAPSRGAGERPKICGQSDEYGRRCDLREHATGDHGRLVGLGLDNVVTWPASPAGSGETGGA
ncbi:hypothetical protein [Streptomyces lydicus]|uniref:hypothetical protein n=1 Tax=Streptomyces lydicus TaxID=47763 RepID=UPI003715B0A0